MKNYYAEKQIIAKVDRKGNIIGRIDKWEAHRLGVLHRGFTVAVFFKDYLILQHRRHPAFDATFDATISSHQLFINERLQEKTDAIYNALNRELNIEKSDLISKPENLGFVYYKAKDPKSEFTEHEIDDVLIVRVKKIPTPNLDYAYGLSFVKRNGVLNTKSRIYNNLAPWVKVMISKNML
jgi:isopentenyl-diphosphate delta-isomerase